MDDREKSSLIKSIEDMTFREQLAALAKDSRFKSLVKCVKKLSPERQKAFQEEIGTEDSALGMTLLSEKTEPLAKKCWRRGFK